MESSNILKKYIITDKINNPDNYIDIDETINNTNNINKRLNSRENSEYILSLLGKCIEKNGTQMYISKSSDAKFKNLELASVQSLFSLGKYKKYELHFDFGNEKNEKILNDPLEKEKFIKEYKENIAKELNIDINNLIFTNLERGSVKVDISNAESAYEGDKTILVLSGKYAIKKIEEKPLLEILKISSEILDPMGDRSEGWG